MRWRDIFLPPTIIIHCFFWNGGLSIKLYFSLSLKLLLHLLQVLNLSMEKIKPQSYSFIPLYSFNIITSLGCCTDVMLPGSWEPGKQILSLLKVTKKSIILRKYRQVRMCKIFFPQLTTYIIDGEINYSFFFATSSSFFVSL